MRVATVFSAILAVCLAVVCAGLFWLEYGLYALILYAVLLVSLPICSFLHELGHMLFGACAKIKARPQFRLFGSSSVALIPKTAKNLKPRVFATAMGGLFVNGLFVILGAVALFVKPCPLWLSVLAPASLYLYLINIFPIITGSGKTDGLILQSLIANEPEAQVMLAVLGVQARLKNGENISEIEECALFDLPQIAEDDEAFIALTELRYEYFLAKGDELKAEEYKNRFEQLKNEYM